MKKIGEIRDACEALLELDVDLKIERVPIEESYGRVLAGEVVSRIPVPSFGRSAYDGYAVCREDIRGASVKNPVTLKVMEVIPAGSIAKYEVSAGKTARIMTGAMIPPGADAVVKYEDTRFTESEVSFVAPAETKNIVEVGEDVKKGICLISPGKIIGAADAAIMAGQGMSDVMVFRQPEIAVISTGSELAAQGQELPAGKIYNTNYYLLGGYIRKYGMIPKNYGIVQDDISILSDKIEEALKKTDMVITTGGVSAGDFDYIPEVMDRIDAKIVFHRLAFKPGGAMLAAVKDGKLILGLSGNPGAAAVGMLRVGLPYMKKLCGRKETGFVEASATLAEAFNKPSKRTRILRGAARVEDGKLMFYQMENQKNGSVSSMLDCDLIGEIPAESKGLSAGTKIKVYFI